MRLLNCDCEIQEIAWLCILPQGLDGVQTPERRETRREPDAGGLRRRGSSRGRPLAGRASRSRSEVRHTLLEMRRSAKFPLTAADITQFRNEAEEQFPEADTSLIEYAVASEVLLSVLGPDWWTERLAGGTEAYFLLDRDDVPGRFVHQHRVVSLANGLLTCQKRPGFAEQLVKFRARSLIGVLHEIGVARLLIRSGHDVEFVSEARVKGADYDLLVDRMIPLEVKAKEDDAAYTATALASTLADARRQLPAAGPGVIALRIPDTWVADSAFVGQGDAEFQRALRNSRRTNAIIVLWDSWVRQFPRGMACMVHFRVYENDDPRTPASGLGSLIRALTLDASLATATSGVEDPPA